MVHDDVSLLYVCLSGCLSIQANLSVCLHVDAADDKSDPHDAADAADDDHSSFFLD